MDMNRNFAEQLKTVSAERLSGVTGISMRTIYRLRNLQHSPTLTTVQRLLAGLEQLRSASEVSAPAAQDKAQTVGGVHKEAA